jgi:hypothetical protein
MRRRFALTRLQAILIIDLLIVASAAGGYYYVQTQVESTIVPTPPPPKPAEFQVANLTLNRLEAEAGQPVIVTVNVTNVGEESGSYFVVLYVNDVLKENKTAQLAGGETTTVEFTLTETNEGTYNVKVDDLTATFEINVEEPNPEEPEEPEPAFLSIYNGAINVSEAWPGDIIKVSAIVINYGDLPGEQAIDLKINNVVEATKTVHLAGKQSTPIEFITNKTAIGEYVVRLNTLNVGYFTVVPTGFHTLVIGAYSGNYAADDLEFTLDGQTQVTPYLSLVPVGTHTVVLPYADPTGKYTFLNWEDGTKDLTRKINVTKPTTLRASYSGGGSSCPSLYIWNGTNYIYVSEVSNHGWLGYIKNINEDGSVDFWRNNPWDYIPLDKNELKPTNGYYNLTLIQRWDEIFYLDAAYMLVVDHPADVNVYSTMVEEYLDPNYMGQIYTASKNPLQPISAVNENGEDVLWQILTKDGVFTPGINGLNSPAWNDITWNRLTLDLGDLSNAKQIKLIVTGVVDWGSSDDYTNWLNGFFAQQVPNGTQVTPPPYMEVKDANGNWVRVPESRQFPIPPDSVPRTFVVDLTGLFLTNDYSLRINNFWNVTFDYIGIDITPQANVTIQRINPLASLYKVFSTTSISAGNFTRYGDVTQLLLNEDDEFVIGKQGDAVSLLFLLDGVEPPAENMERDFFFFDACWFKDAMGNWGFGFGFTVDPLPFHDMSGFPYPPTESYPYDLHWRYLQEYNTRTINPP